jgi:hypothetical protein
MQLPKFVLSHNLLAMVARYRASASRSSASDSFLYRRSRRMARRRHLSEATMADLFAPVDHPASRSFISISREALDPPTPEDDVR